MEENAPAKAIQPPVGKNMGNISTAALKRAESRVCDSTTSAPSKLWTTIAYLCIARIAQMTVEIAIVYA